MKSVKLVWPLKKATKITERFGEVEQRGRPHKGVDLRAKVGTPVFASGEGEVIDVDWKSGYGKIVKIRHSKNVKTRYAHLNRILVRKGQKVKQHERIALSGNTGRTTGPHLHFEILIKDNQVDPIPRLPNR